MSKEGLRSISLELPAALLMALKAEAQAAGRSLSEHVNLLLWAAIKDQRP